VYFFKKLLFQVLINFTVLWGGGKGKAEGKGICGRGTTGPKTGGETYISISWSSGCLSDGEALDKETKILKEVYHTQARLRVFGGVSRTGGQGGIGDQGRGGLSKRKTTVSKQK